ncbi:MULTISPECIES: hypothetical protein [unclassified Arthrobacter]|uniref:hypothetical protein n=1 Tax=unclassified Arthrobacter TaxID=235627 RepID=UPI001D15B7A4|nr:MULTISPECIES: hypothetical protein [unclassified Arthrobacter]MCC3290569.1 hypothetical protein [Arthrobacter sp. zg-Y1110]MCC3299919.1 hypothetical protein [Arthrobacter sp. zg-Y895]UWX84070.1 hypothetical protein N2K99_11275 [Arthrobacter sp. zg-Y1110]
MRSADGTRPGGYLTPSGPTKAPWLGILWKALAVTGSAAVLAAAAAALTADLFAAASSLLGWFVIAAFFGISLLVGHVVGRRNPSGAIGMFAVTYAIKVVGFAVILFGLGTPVWLHREWFALTAVGAVVLWQAAEIRAFSTTRHLIYNDADDSSPQGGANA